MDTLIKADIFFFITTIAIALLSVLAVVLLIYSIRIVRDVKYVSAKMKEETELIAMDIDAARAKIKEEGYKAASIADYFLSFFPRKKRKSHEKK
jgi:hypothetical protein